MAEVHVLSPERCEELLRAGVVGRVAIASPSGPEIIPVDYSVADDAIIFRTTPYSVVGTFGSNAPAAFEVDHFDYEGHRGWSVVARGRIVSVSDPHDLVRIREEWPPGPWTDGVRNRYFRLYWAELSGRHLGDGWTRDDELPVRRVQPTVPQQHSR
jgi:hypothetical protein